MLTLEELYPPFALRVTCGSVELRVLRDDDFPELVEVVRGGVLDPALPMPFLRDWTSEPWGPGLPGHFPATSLTWWWTQRATLSPNGWWLPLVVRRDGAIVGMQDLHAENFLLARTITTGSWLGRAFHGQGIGTLMRQMGVCLGLDHLDALEMHTAYIAGNKASEAVSRKTGYVSNGRRRIAAGGKGVDEFMAVVTPETFVRPAEPVEVTGAVGLRRFLGIDG